MIYFIPMIQLTHSSFCQVVRASSSFIASKTNHVKIDDAQIINCSANILKLMQEKGYNALDPKHFPRHPLYPHISPSSDGFSEERREAILNWVFVVDLLNFSFWTADDEPYSVSYGEKCYNGYWALCALINRAIDAGIPLTTPSYYSQTSLEELRRHFRADKGALPLVEERIRLLKEAGAIIMAKYKGRLSQAFEEIDRIDGRISIDSLMNWLVSTFHSFFDVAWYAGRPVCFMKRAQIMVADLWMAMEGDGPWGCFDDISKLTMFADYRVPQVLMALKVLQVDEELMSRLSGKELMSVHDEAVIELRGCAIEAVERMQRRMKEILLQTLPEHQVNSMVNSMTIDFYLWDWAKSGEGSSYLRNIPIHLTRSHYY